MKYKDTMRLRTLVVAVSICKMFNQTSKGYIIMAENSKKNGNDDRRMIFLTGEINEEKSEKVIIKLIELEFKDPINPILMVVESNGGYVDSMWAIVNTMNMLRCKVYTLVLGKAMSAGSLIFIHGEKGHRFLAPDCRLMFHQIRSCFFGKSEDINSSAKEIERMQDFIYKKISERTNMSLKDVREEMKTDRFIMPKECLQLGIGDMIIKDFGDIGIKDL